ncbi:MAG: hypothetical protein Q9166_000084 [cf. Caloplaca sp. 2 TL-2023]
MSSIFTFDPDPLEVLSSPWPVPLGEQHTPGFASQAESKDQDGMPSATLLADYGIESLDPEPQDGPTEYKLHLLLRPRRSFAALSTVQRVSGSHLSRSRLARLANGGSSSVLKVPTTPASSNQSRESRLQNLTTQLLWRLQQSSPHHSASRSDLVVPVLPGALDPLGLPATPRKLLAGLGDSQGALYEIGVADDGTLVGLTQDELHDSLAVLRTMAYSLGCEVQVLRRVIVGDCQWLEHDAQDGKAERKSRTERVWVVEALISPDLASDGSKRSVPLRARQSDDFAATNSITTTSDAAGNALRTDQLRVSLTGSTTSGKSSLLGTLSTSTLDNGRGKSRLSLLKHRHEIASGVTSSVTGSLIGYHDDSSTNDEDTSRFHVVNYASGNISSWIDIHSASDPGRLVYINDSAGHPKFRRTTVRGLVSWAPHWTICCIAADHEEDTAGRVGATASAGDILGSSCAELDLAKAHLKLCLNLGLPLVIVITKLDLVASMSSLKSVLGEILSILKSAGRRPEILASQTNEHMQSINRNDELGVLEVLSTHPDVDADTIVPIMLTSAVTGKGISTLHALLLHLPIPRLRLPSVDSTRYENEASLPGILFHIDEIFAAADTPRMTRQGSTEISFDSILSGYIRYGSLAVGQEVIIGPFSTSSGEEDLPVQQEIHRANSFPRIKGSPKVDSPRCILPRPLSGDFSIGSPVDDEYVSPAAAWRRVRISSMRNLRLPVHGLSLDQVGTIGLSLPAMFADPSKPHENVVPSSSHPTAHHRSCEGCAPLAPQDRIRKGMVLMGFPSQSGIDSLQVYNGFVASLDTTESLTFHPGGLVIAYIASIRAPARVVESRRLQNEDGVADACRITCSFLASQEWFQIGSQVLVMPASGFDISNSAGDKGEKPSVGLEGLVGRIIQGLA